MTKRSSSTTAVSRVSLTSMSPSPQPPPSMIAVTPDFTEVSSLRALATSISPPLTASPARTAFSLPELDHSPRIAAGLAEAQDTSFPISTSEDSPAATPSMSLASNSTFSDAALSTPHHDNASLVPAAGHTEDASEIENDAPDIKVVEDPSLYGQDDEDEFSLNGPVSSNPPPHAFSQDVAPGSVDPSRISSVSSATSDGEFGIGLSLLQDLMASGSRSSYASSRRDTVSTMATIPDIPAATAYTIPSSSLPADLYLTASPATSPTRATAPTSQEGLQDSQSRSGTSMSQSRSELSNDDWDGNSIYDHYRYSRYSMASKASRLSLMSTYTTGGEVPPMPVDSRRPSVERTRSNETYGRKTPPVPPVILSVPTSPLSPTGSVPPNPAEVIAPLRPRVPAALDLKKTKNRPTKLELNQSPLLHTSFGSPMDSTFSPPNTAGYSSSSPTSRGPSGAVSGAASALRQRLEIERDGISPAASSVNFEVHDPNPEERGGNIVVEDDEPPPNVSASAAGHSPEADDRPMSMESEYTHESTSPAADDPPMRHVSLPRIQVETTTPDPSVVLDARPIPHLGDGATPTSPYPLSVIPSPPSPSVPSPTSSVPPSPAPTSPTAPSPSTSYFGPSRTSLFLPHPNAPRPPTASAGPLYGRKSLHMTHPPPPPPPGAAMPAGSVVHTIHMARGAMYHPSGAPRQPTFYGRLEVDLSMSNGPVPVSFSLEPPQAVPANRMPPPSPVSAAGPSSAVEAAVAPSASEGEPEGESEARGPGQVIQRSNFQPQARTVRPRSQSFSGFDKPSPEESKELAKRYVLTAALAFPSLILKAFVHQSESWNSVQELDTADAYHPVYFGYRFCHAYPQGDPAATICISPPYTTQAVAALTSAEQYCRAGSCSYLGAEVVAHTCGPESISTSARVETGRLEHPASRKPKVAADFAINTASAGSAEKYLGLARLCTDFSGISIRFLRYSSQCQSLAQRRQLEGRHLEHPSADVDGYRCKRHGFTDVPSSAPSRFVLDGIA